MYRSNIVICTMITYVYLYLKNIYYISYFIVFDVVVLSTLIYLFFILSIVIIIFRMHRIHKLSRLSARRINWSTMRPQQTVAAAPPKIEVFIDDKKVLVDPGLTILQVWRAYIYVVMPISFFELFCRHVLSSVSIFHVFAITIVYRLLATVECVLLKLKNR